MKGINDELLAHLPLNNLGRGRAGPAQKGGPIDIDVSSIKMRTSFLVEGTTSKRLRGAVGATVPAANGPTIVPDEYFGGCMYLDAGATYPVDDAKLMESMASSSGLCVCLWFYVSSLGGADKSIIGLESNGKSSIRCLIREQKLFFIVEGSEAAGNTELEEEIWYHLAFCHDGTRGVQTLFLNGRSECQITQPIDFKSHRLNLYLGRGEADSFVGKAANLRVYGKALSEEELCLVYRDMDRSAQAGFKLAYPIDFRIYDGGTNNTLFISDKKSSRTFQLEIRNCSGRDMLLKPARKEGSGRPYNFALEFHPGILRTDLNARNDISLPSGWEADFAEADGRIVIFFTYKGDETHLPADSNLTFSVAYGSAGDAGPGGTTILLLYQGLYFTGYDNQLKGTRIAHAEVTSRVGKREAPFYAGIIESDALINDGKPRAPLILGIANAYKELDIDLWSRDGSRPASLYLSVLWGLLDLALCGDDDMRQVDIEPVKHSDKSPSGWEPDPEWEKLAPSGQDDYQWKFLPNNNKRQLKAGEALYLRITGLGTSKVTGVAPLTLRYAGLPGWWDGELKIPVRKGPLAAHDGKVGIGTDRPESKLHIVDEGCPPGQATLMLGPAETDGLGLGSEAEYSWIKSPKSTPLVLNPTGSKVGIGTEAPTAALEVRGNIVADSLETKGRIKDQSGILMPVGAILAYGGATAPDGWLLCDGRPIPDEPRYKELRAVVGSKTPDLLLRTIIGAGRNDAIVMGKTVLLNEASGEWSHVLGINEMPSHTHAYHKAAWNYGHRDGGTDWTRYGHQDQPNNGTTSAEGGGAAHNNMPPYYALNYIIKY